MRRIRWENPPRSNFRVAGHSGSILLTFFPLGAAVAQNVQPSRKPDVAYVPTKNEAVEARLKLADVTSSDTVYDLGCGAGRIVIAAAKLRGARGVGIGIDPLRISESRAKARKAGFEKRVRFEENNVFEADIHEAKVVTLFLLPELNVKLLPKLLRDSSRVRGSFQTPSIWVIGRRRKK